MTKPIAHTEIDNDDVYGVFLVNEDCSLVVLEEEKFSEVEVTTVEKKPATKATVKKEIANTANTVKKGQTFNQVCPFTEDHTGQTVEVLKVKAAANGQPAALVRIVSSNYKDAVGYEFGVYIVAGGLQGYEEDLYSEADEDEEPAMKTFKNTAFKNRHYETTNIVFCQSEKAPEGNDWEECKEDDLSATNCTQIYMQAGVRYYGYL